MDIVESIRGFASQPLTHQLLRSLLKDYKRPNDRSVNGLTEEQFLNLFKKRISFVMGFTSHLSEDLLVDEAMDKFDSNIARFSLIQCSNDMRSNYYDLLFCQIRRA